MSTATECTKLDIGQGLLQLENAFDLSQHLNSVPVTLNGFDISVTDSSNIVVEYSKFGIYLREPYLTESPQDFNVTIKPKFREESGKFIQLYRLVTSHPPLEHVIKIEFERKIALVSNAPYIHHTDFLFLTNHSSPFQLRVDPTGLEKGRLLFLITHKYSRLRKGLLH